MMSLWISLELSNPTTKWLESTTTNIGEYGSAKIIHSIWNQKKTKAWEKRSSSISLFSSQRSTVLQQVFLKYFSANWKNLHITNSVHSLKYYKRSKILLIPTKYSSAIRSPSTQIRRLVTPLNSIIKEVSCPSAPIPAWQISNMKRKQGYLPIKISLKMLDFSNSKVSLQPTYSMWIEIIIAWWSTTQTIIAKNIWTLQPWRIVSTAKLLTNILRLSKKAALPIPSSTKWWSPSKKYTTNQKTIRKLNPILIHQLPSSQIYYQNLTIMHHRSLCLLSLTQP